MDRHRVWLQRAYTAVLGLATGWSCRQVPRHVTVGSVAGCYALSRFGGRTTPLGVDMPDTLRLDSVPNLNPDGRPHPYFPWRMDILSRRPDAGTRPLALERDTVWLPAPWTREYNFVGWRFVPPDSVVVALWPPGGGGAGWEMQLRAVGDSLVGRAEAQSDMLPDPRGVVSVTGRRTPCRPRSEAGAPAT